VLLQPSGGAVFSIAPPPVITYMTIDGQTTLSGAYNNFLYSPVSDDRDQMPTSVLSALARHDIDPWEEAARLAQMPKSIAIARLTSIISAVNSDLRVKSEAELVATRLVELLPQSNVLGVPERDQFPLPQAADFLRAAAVIAIAVLLVALAMSGN
jgi:hypothetical protein